VGFLKNGGWVIVLAATGSILGLIVLFTIIFTIISSARQEAQDWSVYKAEHNCKAEVSYGGALSKWVCDNDTIHWR